MVLQLAELEGATAMPPYERAQFESDLGRIWQRQLGDRGEAERAYGRALAIDAEFPPALEGLAGLCLETGRIEEAASLLERLTARLRGPERAPFWLSLGRLYAVTLGDRVRARRCFEAALEDDPLQTAAVEWGLLLATEEEDWETVANLLEHRFDLAAGARHRASIAVEASQIHLHQRRSPSAARVWIDRASELAEDDGAVLRASADVARAEEDDDALAAVLERLVRKAGDRASQGLVLELAHALARAGRPTEALAQLERMRAGASGHDPNVLELRARLLRETGARRALAEVLETLVGMEAGQSPDDRAARLQELARLCGGGARRSCRRGEPLDVRLRARAPGHRRPRRPRTPPAQARGLARPPPDLRTRPPRQRRHRPRPPREPARRAVARTLRRARERSRRLRARAHPRRPPPPRSRGPAPHRRTHERPRPHARRLRAGGRALRRRAALRRARATGGLGPRRPRRARARARMGHPRLRPQPDLAQRPRAASRTRATARSNGRRDRHPRPARRPPRRCRAGRRAPPPRDAPRRAGGADRRTCVSRVRGGLHPRPDRDPRDALLGRAATRSSGGRGPLAAPALRATAHRTSRRAAPAACPTARRPDRRSRIGDRRATRAARASRRSGGCPRRARPPARARRAFGRARGPARARARTHRRQRARSACARPAPRTPAARCPRRLRGSGRHLPSAARARARRRRGARPARTGAAGGTRRRGAL
ncbi:MAG: tetratricopeptide repeat protein [Deltaproteobacteria bacterium]|nr:tetratricopeptide repeat protein [Deltaproteobacteria bacterium]